MFKNFVFYSLSFLVLFFQSLPSEIFCLNNRALAQITKHNINSHQELEVTGLAILHSSKTDHYLILPVLGDEPFEDAVARYLNAIKNNHDMKKQLEIEKLCLIDIISTKKPVSLFKPLSKDKRPIFLLLANKFEDLVGGRRISNIITQLQDADAITYILPLSVDLSLTKKQAKIFRALLAEKFDVLFALGGNDVAPSLYKKPVTFAEQINFTRDLSEYRIIDSFIKRRRGVFYGICRGHQLGAVVQGEALIQDLFLEKQITDLHQNGIYHPILVSNDSQSLLAGFLSGRKRVEVNSFHHQAVNLTSGNNIRVVATSGKDGQEIIEAYQFKNGLGLGVQFHPEDMRNDIGKAIIGGMVEYARFVKEARTSNINCANLIANFVSKILNH